MNFLELTVPDASQFALGMRVPLLGGRASGFIVKLAFDNLHSRDNSRAGVLLVDDIKDPNGLYLPVLCGTTRGMKCHQTLHV